MLLLQVGTTSLAIPCQLKPTVWLLPLQIGKLTGERDMLQSNISDLKERQGAARREIEEMRRQLKDSEVAKRDAEDRVLKLQQGTDKTKVTSTFHIQRWAKKWSPGCENFLPGHAWLVLSKTVHHFSPSL